MSDPIVSTISKALANTQRALESEQSRNEQLVARLHDAGKREEKYQMLIKEQKEFIDLLEGHWKKETSDA